MGNLLSEPVKTVARTSGENGRFSYGSASVQGWRPYQEDDLQAVLDLSPTGKLDASPVAYFGMFDGHGGADVSALCARQLHFIFAKSEAFAKGNVPQALAESFLNFDYSLIAEIQRSLVEEAKAGKEKGDKEKAPLGYLSGCAAVVVVVTESTVYCANAGDSRAVLCRDGKAFALSQDHKPSLPEEKKRILAAGGTVVDDRVNGSLAMSRAIGDLVFKTNPQLGLQDQAVTSMPELVGTTVIDKDEFLILATDGIWDMLSTEECVAFVRAELEAGTSPEAVCEKLCERCLSPNPRDTLGNGTDNMSALVVKFKRPADPRKIQEADAGLTGPPSPMPSTLGGGTDTSKVKDTSRLSLGGTASSTIAEAAARSSSAPWSAAGQSARGAVRFPGVAASPFPAFSGASSAPFSHQQRSVIAAATSWRATAGGARAHRTSFAAVPKFRTTSALGLGFRAGSPSVFKLNRKLAAGATAARLARLLF